MSRMVSDPGVALVNNDEIRDRRISDFKTPNLPGGIGRMRIPQRSVIGAEDTLAQIAQDAESRLAAKRRERAERRTIKLAEIKRRQTIDEEEKVSNGSLSPIENGDGITLSASSSVSSGIEKVGRDRLESHGSMRDRGESLDSAASTGGVSRTGSVLVRRESDASSHSQEADGEARVVSFKEHKELKQKLAEWEDKFKKCMISNEQLDNEKSALSYKLDLVQDKYDEQEEKLFEANRMCKEKSREVERGKRAVKDLERTVGLLRQQLQQRQDLVVEHGLVLVGGEIIEEDVEGDDGSTETKGKVGPAAIITPTAAALLEKSAGSEGTLDARLRKFAAEKEELRDAIRKVKTELDTLKVNNHVILNGINESEKPQPPEEDEGSLKIKEDKKRLEESNLKLAKAEMEMTNLEATVSRMDQQIKRYQEMLVESEKTEDEVKTEKRKLQRELREAITQVEELSNANKHLQTRLDKVRAVRGVLQNELNKPI